MRTTILFDGGGFWLFWSKCNYRTLEWSWAWWAELRWFGLEELLSPLKRTSLELDLTGSEEQRKWWIRWTTWGSAVYTQHYQLSSFPEAWISFVCQMRLNWIFVVRYSNFKSPITHWLVTILNLNGTHYDHQRAPLESKQKYQNNKIPEQNKKKTTNSRHNLVSFSYNSIATHFRLRWPLSLCVTFLFTHFFFLQNNEQTHRQTERQTRIPQRSDFVTREHQHKFKVKRKGRRRKNNIKNCLVMWRLS